MARGSSSSASARSRSGDDMIDRWMVIAALAVAGCAGQAQFSDGGVAGPLPASPTPPPPLPQAPPYVVPPPTQTYVYPERGQSPQQQESDKGQCYAWAVQQSGFDPANPRVATPPPPPAQIGSPQAPSGGLSGGALGGAMGGAALGAVGGAIGGSAGEGAAIGAGVGALFGLMRRARSMEEQRQEMQLQQRQQQSSMAQQQNAMAQGRGNYERAFSACMAGRGYAVG